jgi:outer membrane scaffolding protein for murein synthesis (MipA/OmpV family)
VVGEKGTVIRLIGLAALGGCALSASNAHAQADERVEDDRSRITIGVGAATLPDYEGSDQNSVTPGAVIVGKIAGHDVFTRGTQLYVNLVPSGDGPRTNFELGLIGAARLDRTNKVDNLQAVRSGRSTLHGKPVATSV